MDSIARFRGPAGQERARAALDALCVRDIPPTPANYEIWISYLLGLNPDLNREIDRRLAEGAVFSDAANGELHERFFANTRLSLQLAEAGEGIARELTDVVSSLRGAGEHTKTYAGALAGAASDFERGLDAAGLRALMSMLAVATRQMADHSAGLLQQMETSARQVEALQITLQNVKVEALTDSLTGLANRKCFDETLRRRVSEAQASGEPLCLMMCDIDHFKRFNDTWGHAVGDQVLRFVASVLKQHARGDFLAARYGGEEFAMIMPRVSKDAALDVCSAIWNAIRAKHLARRSTAERLGRATASFGLAQWRAPESLAALVARADACLYESKRNGRDRITCDEEGDCVTGAANAPQKTATA